MTQSAGSYLLAGQPTELERLQLQSRVWEPAGRALLAQLAGGSGLRVLDVGCGVKPYETLFTETTRYVGMEFDSEGNRSKNRGEIFYNIALEGITILPYPGLSLIQSFVGAFANPAGITGRNKASFPDGFDDLA